MADITVYGANWCEDTNETREQLDQLGIPYDYIDIDQRPEAKEWVIFQNQGEQRTPTLNIDGDILVEPNESQLIGALRVKGLVDW
jgi:mycoredoxin